MISSKPMRVTICIALSALLVVALAPPVHGCTCIFYSHRKDFRNAKAVFIGTVVAIAPNNRKRSEPTRDCRYVVTFRLERSWKGTKGGNIVAFSDSGEGGCGGTRFRVGGKYLVYAYDDDGVLDAETGCRRTRPVDTTDLRNDAEVRQLSSRWFRIRSRMWPF